MDKGGCHSIVVQSDHLHGRVELNNGLYIVLDEELMEIILNYRTSGIGAAAVDTD